MLRIKTFNLIGLIALTVISFKGFAHDTDGFFVIPVPTKVEVIEEVCTGTSAGAVVFNISTHCCPVN